MPAKKNRLQIRVQLFPGYQPPTSMKKYLLFAVIFFSIPTLMAQQKPCSEPVYRQFDFWLGEWEVFNTNGSKAGDSKILIMLDSCVIREEWTSTTLQQGVRYAGRSYNTYNKAKKTWQQYWVDNAGGVTEFCNGHFENNKMILETDNTKQPDGTYKIQKMTFYGLGPDKVRQWGESSTDGGKTWNTDFDLAYRKKK
ncbi:MAG: hypothetical protein IPP72_06780 [Chitinophagaceae bacterium]|nr:hypothetical protein [Chitinophagaceae bacterium]